MIATSIPRVRKANFHRFYVVHNVGAFSFFLLLLFHGMYNGQPYTWKWCIGKSAECEAYALSLYPVLIIPIIWMAPVRLPPCSRSNCAVPL